MDRAAQFEWSVYIFFVNAAVMRKDSKIEGMIHRPLYTVRD